MKPLETEESDVSAKRRTGSGALNVTYSTFVFLALVWWSVLAILTLTGSRSDTSTVRPGVDFIGMRCGSSSFVKNRPFLFVPIADGVKELASTLDLDVHHPICIARCPSHEDVEKHPTLEAFNHGTTHMYGESIGVLPIYPTETFSNFMCVPVNAKSNTALLEQLDLHSRDATWWIYADQLSNRSIVITVLSLFVSMTYALGHIGWALMKPVTAPRFMMIEVICLAFLFTIIILQHQSDMSLSARIGKNSASLSLIFASVISTTILSVGMFAYAKRSKVASVIITTSAEAVMTMPGLYIMPLITVAIVSSIILFSLAISSTILVSQGAPIANLLSDTATRSLLAVSSGTPRLLTMESSHFAFQTDDLLGTLSPDLESAKDQYAPQPEEPSVVYPSPVYPSQVYDSDLLEVPRVPVANEDDGWDFLNAELVNPIEMRSKTAVENKVALALNHTIEQTQGALPEDEMPIVVDIPPANIAKKEKASKMMMLLPSDAIQFPISWRTKLNYIGFFFSTIFLIEFFVSFNLFVVSAWTCIWYFSMPEITGQRSIDAKNVREATSRLGTKHFGTIALVACLNALTRPFRSIFQMTPYIPGVQKQLNHAALLGHTSTGQQFLSLYHRVICSMSGVTITECLLHGQELIAAAKQMLGRSPKDKSVARLLRFGALQCAVPIQICGPILAGLMAVCCCYTVPLFSSNQSSQYIPSWDLCVAVSFITGFYAILVVTSAFLQIAETITACYQLDMNDRHNSLSCTPEQLTIVSSQIRTVAAQIALEEHGRPVDPMDSLTDANDANSTALLMMMSLSTGTNGLYTNLKMPADQERASLVRRPPDSHSLATTTPREEGDWVSEGMKFDNGDAENQLEQSIGADTRQEIEQTLEIGNWKVYGQTPEISPM